MYSSLVQTPGVASVNSQVSQVKIQSTNDGGLQVDTSSVAGSGTAGFPDRLRDYLIDVRLLRKIPLPYLVPDPALLPTESIRFFHIDQTWVERVIDGIFSAANTGTLDTVYSVTMMQLVRNTIDNELTAQAKALVPATTWTGNGPMTGMLIRSELVRRWPDMIVTAYTGKDDTTPGVAVLRCEAISQDILIAVFAGRPTLVEIREPHVGIRFGVEDTNGLAVEKRDATGTPGGSLTVTLRTWVTPVQNTVPIGPLPLTGTPVAQSAAQTVAQTPVMEKTPATNVTLQPGTTVTGGISTHPPIEVLPKLPDPRVIDIEALAKRIPVALDADGSPRLMAMQLERPPYVQRFLQSVDENVGSVPVRQYIVGGVLQGISLGKGRIVKLDALAARAAQLPEEDV
jgi:hypothetical protein